jgi:endonuclease-3
MIIATILSQNTNDRNSYKAYKNLKEKYPRWELLASMPAASIEKTIRVAGLGKQKSAGIKNLVKTLIKEKGTASLKYLSGMTDEEILDELTKYPGVGVKTAACVLLFSMDRNICPVDTHVHRTLNRIGVVTTNSPDKTFVIVNKHIPQGIAHSFHTNLIRLGREICRPGLPYCSICPLKRICLYKEKNLLPPPKNYSIPFMLLDNV